MSAEDTSSDQAGIPAAASLANAVDTCREIAESLGADGFSLFFAAVHGEARRIVPVFDSTFPGVSLETRTLSSPTAILFARQVTETTCPVWWRTEGGSAFMSASAKVWTVEAKAPINTVSGIAFPVSSDRRRAGTVVFTGSAMTIDEATLCDAHARCFELFGDVAEQRQQECNAPKPMSKRELECLRLTANGLTSDEIATSLGLSVHTANQYLTNSTHKLNAMNRIHAVAKALRGGMIA
jgi:DNA-binding CsgD family transcriptional regulator